jgi:hypothetical protein
MTHRKKPILFTVLVVFMGVLFTQIVFGAISGILLTTSAQIPNPSIAWVTMLAFFVQGLHGVLLTWFVGLMVDWSTASHIVGPWAASYLVFYMILVAIPPKTYHHSLMNMIFFTALGCFLTDMIHDLLVFESWMSALRFNDVLFNSVCRIVAIVMISPVVYSCRLLIVRRTKSYGW